MNIKKLFKKENNLLQTSDMLGYKLSSMIERDHKYRCVVLITREKNEAHTTITGSSVTLIETLTGVLSENKWLVEIFDEAIKNIKNDLKTN